jgi:hypothetical protein
VGKISPWLRYAPRVVHVAMVAPSSNSYRVGCSVCYAMHDSSLLDSLACLMPAAPSCCFVLAGAHTCLQSTGGRWGRVALLSPWLCCVAARACPPSGARCDGVHKHTATGLQQRMLPCLQLSPLVEQRTTCLAQGGKGGKYDSLECGMPAR